MSDLVIPGSAAPSNLHLAHNVRAAMVSGDVYDICSRIKEVDPTLFIIQLEDDDAHRCAYAVMEHCSDGVERLVYKTKELDQRILEKCRYLKSVPFEHRFAEIEAEIDRQEAEEKARASEEFYERMGLPMWKQLEDSGFIQRRSSYAKRGVALAGRM